MAFLCISPVLANYPAYPRVSGDPGRQVFESVVVVLDSRLRGNERSMWVQA